ncbi:MAG: amino acid permease [Lactobacillales bacterium]|jgi:APA family basic amino acid/polyamine antiporter|nr:amino acid permease [Lactobacillales bacterium]
MKIFRKPTLKYILEHTTNDSTSLKKSLNWFNIAILATSTSVGAGIFSVGAQIINQIAGPAAIISFAIAGAICFLAALCYAEFAYKIPVAGASYTFAYATIGEIVAWVLSWSLLLGLMMAISTELKAWCTYLYETVAIFGIDWHTIHVTLFGFGLGVDLPILIGGVIFGGVLIYSTKAVAKVANVLTVIKLVILVVIIVTGAIYFKAANMHPFFLPKAASHASESFFGVVLGVKDGVGGFGGVLSGAAVATFAFLGFDTATTASEETENPRRNMPLGLIVGILVIIVIYIAIALVSAGMVNHQQIADYLAAHPTQQLSLVTGFKVVGAQGGVLAALIGHFVAIGIFIGLTGITMVGLMGISRTIFAVSRDGLLPKRFGKTGGPHKTPIFATVVGTIGVILCASFGSTAQLAEITCMATLSAFTIVSFAIPVLRKNKEFAHYHNDGFKVPWSPVLPIIAGLACIWLMGNLSFHNWIITALWAVAGVVVYFVYGYRHSLLGKNPDMQQ